MKSESTFRPVIWLMSGRALGQAAAFLIPVVLARVFDPATFGSYKRLFLLYGTLYGIAQIGLAESLYYFLPRSPKDAGRLAANSMLGLSTAGLICFGALTVWRGAVATALGDASLAGLIPWIGLFLGPMLISSVLEISMVSRKSAGQAALAYMGSDLLRAGFLVVPALLFFSLRAVIAGAIGFAIARLIASLIYLSRETHDLRFDRALLKTQLAYALPFALAVGVDVVQQNFSQIVVSNRTDAATFAVYSVALLQVPLVDQTATTTSSVAMVQMGEALHRGEHKEVQSIWQDTVAKLGLMFFPLVALLIVASREIITVLFTAKYTASVPLFRLASLGILIFMLQTDTMLRVLAETRFLFAMNLTRMALLAALIFPALSHFGLAGAIGATLVSSLVARAIGIARISYLQKLSLRDVLPWRRIGLAVGISAGAGMIALAVRAQIPWPAFPKLVITSLIFSIAYLALARLLNLLPPIAPGGWLTWIRGAPVAAVANVKEQPCAASPER